MTIDLSGKTVILTGAFGRLGRILTRRLLDDGATVAGIDRHTADPITDSDRLHLFKADVGDEGEVEAVFTKIRDTVGPADGLVHTVGMWDGQPFAETPLADWINAGPRTSPPFWSRATARNWLIESAIVRSGGFTL